ncbi:ABC transporter family protein [Giardia muris]|uniref:ABC transporter family protein n=1 Tax=Giardia muris TaxID=5742 RepID=A0A4Z1SWN7_GIAMU|nr:ABC transporter family protein [Giardia muris]|eukprot:TNJ27938.1 ABC transporter family protein [Giardia muris]
MSTLDRDYALKRSERSRQFLGVFIKNWRLLAHSWGSFLGILITVVVIIGAVIGMHFYYVGNSSESSGGTITTWDAMLLPNTTMGGLFRSAYFFGGQSIEQSNISYTIDGTNAKAYDTLLNRIGYKFWDADGATNAMRALSSDLSEATMRVYETNPSTSQSEPLVHSDVGVPYFKNFVEYVNGYTFPDFTDQNLADQLYNSSDTITIDNTSSLSDEATKKLLMSYIRKAWERYRDAPPRDESVVVDLRNRLVRTYFVTDLPAFAVRLHPTVKEDPLSIVLVNGQKTLSLNIGYDMFLHRNGQDFRVSYLTYSKVLSFQNVMFQSFLRAMTKQVFNAILGANDVTFNETNQPYVMGNYGAFWKLSSTAQGPDSFTPLLMIMLIPLLSYIISPLFVYTACEEKGAGLVHLHSMMGQRYTSKWFADYTYNFLLSLCVETLIVILSLAGDLKGIKDNTVLVWLPTMLLMAASVPVLSAFFAAFSESGRVTALVAIVFSFVISIGTFIASIGFAAPTLVDRSLSPWLGLVPFFGPCAIMAQLQGLAVLQNSELSLHASDLSFVPKRTDLGRYYVGASVLPMFFLSVISLVLMAVLAMYLDLVWPKRNGIANHWLFFLFPLVNKVDRIRNTRTKHFTTKSVCYAVGWAVTHPILMCRRAEPQAITSTNFVPRTGALQDTERSPAQKKGDEAPSQIQGQLTDTQRAIPQDGTDELVSPEPEEDIDVKAERLRAFTDNVGYNGKPIVIRALRLTKTYPARFKQPEKHAVRGISFTVAMGECLGLLGPNGAAKTTTINILTLLHRATSGDAYIDQKNLVDPANKKFIQSVTGICPQFDMLYPTLTCRQHLEYFCDLKSIDKSEKKQHVDDLLGAVGLLEKENVMVKSLSGGQKRRLSVAIALTGSPYVLYLDEPSTGLDPGSKRLLWNVILKVRPGRAILLTTHAMDEAQALCNRIAIMDKGRLRCIGTCVHLQNKYGGKLHISVGVRKNSPEVLQGVMPADNAIVDGVKLKNGYEIKIHALVTAAFQTVVTLIRCVGDTLLYEVGEELSVSDIFVRMAELAFTHQRLIADWDLIQNSMDRVFFSVILQAQQ